MRKNRENQLPLTSLWPDHQLSYELQMISRILDDNPEILDLVLQDLSDKTDPQKGSPGLSAEQVLRCGRSEDLAAASPTRSWPFTRPTRSAFERFAACPWDGHRAKAVCKTTLAGFELPAGRRSIEC